MVINYALKLEEKNWEHIQNIVLLSSHDLRRSFATNYFGKIETPILMQITGHSKESTFLSYIGTQVNKDTYADAFMKIAATL